MPGRPLRPSGAGFKAVSPANALHQARDRERAGCVREAVACYQEAIAEAERQNQPTVLAEALRRLAVLQYQRDEQGEARMLCRRSQEVALEMDSRLLLAEALNSQGGMDLMSGALDEARAAFLEALKLAGEVVDLRARAVQNLGILSNIQGQLDEAHTWYQESLEAYRTARNEHGCAIAYHNLGMISTDKGELNEADRYFRESFEIAERIGDLRLQGLCLLNHAEVYLTRQRYDEARRNVETALSIFDQLGSRRDKSDAYRVIGMVYRETGRTALAESRLKSAVELAADAEAVLNEAEATHELAILYQSLSRNQEALTLLNAAHRLFGQLKAQTELVNIGAKVAELEATYTAAVREWGQSIESTDSYTFGHCGRVADYAVAIADALGLDEQGRKTVRLGAYLHDLGKVRVPHEILNKPGPLTSDEHEVVKMHPVWGLELLEEVEFPWDLKAVIRWHHEKYDGTGYPDRLQGDDIPLVAQIVGMADVWDALTSDRAYRRALSPQAAMAQMVTSRGWWSDEVYQAFLAAVDSFASVPASTRSVATA